MSKNFIFLLIFFSHRKPILSSGATPKTVTPIWSLGHIVRTPDFKRSIGGWSGGNVRKPSYSHSKKWGWATLHVQGPPPLMSVSSMNIHYRINSQVVFFFP